MTIETAANAMTFAVAGRALTDRANELGVTPSRFRSPPRLPGVRRSVTRNTDGSVTIAVVVSRRPLTAVIADMIDGVVLASGLASSDARSLYDDLWSTAHGVLIEISHNRATRPASAPTARRVLQAVA